jgi:hypothetical protein
MEYLHHQVPLPSNDEPSVGVKTTDGGVAIGVVAIVCFFVIFLLV